MLVVDGIQNGSKQTGTNTINHPAVVEKKWIVDKAAWVETVTTGHTCSGCGAKK